MNEHKYVGVDAHKATTTFAVRNAAGKVTAKSTVETKAAELIAAVRSIPGTVHLTFEEGTMAAWLYEIFRPHVAEIIVCDPRKNRLLGHGNKDDDIDAEKLSELLRGGFLSPVYHGESRSSELRTMVRTYNKLVEDSGRAMNQVKAVFRSRGLSTEGGDVYAPEERDAWLTKLPSEAQRQYARCTLTQLDLAMKLRAESEGEMVEAAKRDPAWRRLKTVPGIGPIRAAQIIGIVGTPHRFRTKRQLWSYCGLAVVTRSSADYDVRASGLVKKHRPSTRGLNHNHSPFLKHVLKAAALDAIRSGLREHHEGLVAGGMREEMARLTIARKLAAIILSIWKKGEKYDPAKTLKRTK